MKDELKATPAPAEAGKRLSPAPVRMVTASPDVSGDRLAILAELGRKAAESTRYHDWPERVPGVPIGFLPGHAGPLCYELDTHRLVIGKSGGGKATAAISYMLLHDDGHAVVLIDPKSGGVTRTTAGYRQRLGPVHIVDPYNMTGFFGEQPCARLNPLDILEPTSATLVEDAANLASALCYLPQGGGNDQTYWDRQARSYATGLLLHLVTAPGETADLLRLRELLTLPFDLFLVEVIRPMQGNPACSGTVRRYGLEMERHAVANPRGFEDVFATIRSYVPWIEFQQVRAVTARTTFNFADVREGGGTVYIVMDDDRLDECASWVRLMLQAARLGLKRASSRRPVHFIIDEAAALGKLDLITTGLRAWREAKIRLHLFYQDIAQIKSAFREGWASVAATDVVQFMGCNPLDTETAEHLSKVLGERDMIVPTFGDGTSASSGTSSSQAQGKSSTDTVGNSTSSSESATRTLGSSWSTTVGGSHTISTSSSRSRGGTSHGTSESYTSSWSDTHGGSRSNALGRTEGHGATRSSASGQTQTETQGTTQSEGSSISRSFTLQLRRSMRPEQVRMLSDEQMIVIAGNREPALVYKEHYFRNPRLVARALMRYNPAVIGPTIGKDSAGQKSLAPARTGSLLSGLLSILLSSGRD